MLEHHLATQLQSTAPPGSAPLPSPLRSPTALLNNRANTEEDMSSTQSRPSASIRLLRRILPITRSNDVQRIHMHIYTHTHKNLKYGPKTRLSSNPQIQSLTSYRNTL